MGEPTLKPGDVFVVTEGEGEGEVFFVEGKHEKAISYWISALSPEARSKRFETLPHLIPPSRRIGRGLDLDAMVSEHCGIHLPNMDKSTEKERALAELARYAAVHIPSTEITFVSEYGIRLVTGLQYGNAAEVGNDGHCNAYFALEDTGSSVNVLFSIPLHLLSENEDGKDIYYRLDELAAEVGYAKPADPDVFSDDFGRTVLLNPDDDSQPFDSVKDAHDRLAYVVGELSKVYDIPITLVDPVLR